MSKRTFDMALALVGLVLTAPLLALIALLVRVDSRGPVLFKQERVGKDGRPFRILKFRTMVQGAAALGPRLTRKRDPRITRVGQVLRWLKLDELPQLFNVLRGDMSFVGPRPLAEQEIETGSDGAFVPLAAIPGYVERHSVRPGLTGLTQVFARRDLPRRGKFRLDRLYVRHAGFCLDVRLVALSFWITLRGRWEHRGRKV
jgi:lipopolysaccharide/colanic/teichoic acid biosynthesis glycosyltransferase